MLLQRLLHFFFQMKVNEVSEVTPFRRAAISVFRQKGRSRIVRIGVSIHAGAFQ
jgi:hypothetical protein